MCGICGKLDPRGVTKAAIGRMAASLAHRGPDEEGVFVDGPVGLGHRRLSIIDLTGGQQPMQSADGSLRITFNGEIYNYRELRAELEALGRHFVTQSDTEVILALYEQRGRACVQSLRGMFAFAIHDAKAGRLFLARDHLGQKPLYYTYNGEQFAFASEIKALLADDPSLREMDEKALHQYLTLRIIASPRTMYRRIMKLPPGHALVFERGSVTVERYWNLSYEPKDHRSEDDLLEELDAHILDAVKYCMVSDVPVGAFLSGGLDSGLVVGMMARHSAGGSYESARIPRGSGGAFPTFSAAIPYAEYDESPVAALVSRQYGTTGTIETLDASIVNMLPEIVWHLDEPADPLSLCTYFISSIARKHVKVVLSGDGGDELFAGYDRYGGNRYINRYAMLPRYLREHFARSVIDLIPDRFSQKSLSQKLRWVNRLSLVDPDCRYARSLGHFFFTEEFRSDLYGERLQCAVAGYDPEEGLDHYFAEVDEREPIDRMLHADTMIRLPAHSLMILDRMSMAHGLEARSPFLDHKLAEFAATLPVQLKVKGPRLRYLQKRLGRRYLPDEVFASGKRGFGSGLTYLLDAAYRGLFDVFLRDSHLVREGYLQLAAVKRIFDDHLMHKVDHHNRLWLLCHAEVWYRMMIEGATVDGIRAEMRDAAV